MISTAQQLEQLVTRVSTNCDCRGGDLVAKAEIAAKLELIWLGHLRQAGLTGTADCLLEGAMSAIREGASCIALGLVRPALNSIRIQIDLVLGWLYFKDHSVEWGRVQDTGDGYKLKTDLIKYVSESYAGYGSRFGILKDCRVRTCEEPYRLLSAHIHGQSEYALPVVVNAADIVASEKLQDEAVLLQSECSEYVNDVLWSIYKNSWPSLPNILLTDLNCRFKSAEQRTAFFA